MQFKRLVVFPPLFVADHGTVIREQITCKSTKSILNYESLLNLACYWSRAPLAINKKQECFPLPDHQLAENLILVFGFYERAKQGYKWICN